VQGEWFASLPPPSARAVYLEKGAGNVKTYYMGCWRRERKPRNLVKDVVERGFGMYDDLRIVWRVPAGSADHARELIQEGQAEVVHEKKVVPHQLPSPYLIR